MPGIFPNPKGKWEEKNQAIYSPASKRLWPCLQRSYDEWILSEPDRTHAHKDRKDDLFGELVFRPLENLVKSTAASARKHLRGSVQPTDVQVVSGFGGLSEAQE